MVGWPAPIPKAKETYEHCLAEVAKSPTAQQIIKTLTKSPKKIGIFVSRMPKEDDEEDFQPVPEFIPPLIYAATPLAHEFDGGVAIVQVGNPITYKVDGKLVKTTPGVSLMHELGHAVQLQTDEKHFMKYCKIKIEAADAKKDSKKVRQAMQDFSTSSYREGAMLIIEQENLKLHENPVCQELGIPVRLRYS
jgi:hypothetical protein